MEIGELLRVGEGRVVNLIGHEADMTEVGLAGTTDDPWEFAIHICTDVDIYYKGEWFTGSCEMDDSQNSLFDRKIRGMMEEVPEIRLERVTYDESFQLHVFFDNSLEIHGNRDDEGDVEWWLFYLWKAEDTLICEGNNIRISRCTKSQEELNQSKKSWEERRRARKQRVE